MPSLQIYSASFDRLPLVAGQINNTLTAQGRKLLGPKVWMIADLDGRPDDTGEDSLVHKTAKTVGTLAMGVAASIRNEHPYDIAYAIETADIEIAQREMPAAFLGFSVPEATRVADVHQTVGELIIGTNEHLEHLAVLGNARLPFEPVR